MVPEGWWTAVTWAFGDSDCSPGDEQHDRASAVFLACFHHDPALLDPIRAVVAGLRNAVGFRRLEGFVQRAAEALGVSDVEVNLIAKSETIQLEIVTPTGVALREAVNEVTARIAANDDPPPRPTAPPRPWKSLRPTPCSRATAASFSGPRASPSFPVR